MYYTMGCTKRWSGMWDEGIRQLRGVCASPIKVSYLGGPSEGCGGLWGEWGGECAVVATVWWIVWGVERAVCIFGLGVFGCLFESFCENG